MKKVSMLLALMVLQTLFFISSITIPMEEEGKILYCSSCGGSGIVNCAGVHMDTKAKNCNKSGTCTVTVYKYLHGGICSGGHSLMDTHDHTEYHSGPICYPVQGVCDFY